MSDVSFIVAAAITKLVARIWVNDNSVDGVAEDIKDVFFRVKGPGAGQRRAALQMEGIAESLSERIAPFLERETPNLTDGDRLIAVESVSKALRSIAVTTVRDLIERNMNATHLANLIRDAIHKAQGESGLGDDGEALQERLLVESALCVLEIASRMPEYAATRDELLLSRSSKLEQMVEDVLARLPNLEITGTRSVEDEKYENLFRIAIGHRTDQVRLFGLQGQTSNPHYPLSIAYISLAVDSGPNEDDEISDDDIPASKIGTEAPQDSKLEDLLKEANSLLLVGGAGSGKTTLLNWIGLSSVSANVATNVPESWRERVPFILPLRQFATTTLPSVDALPSTTAPTLGLPPQGWAQRVFADGRATLLVDGLDEVSRRRRSEVHSWLAEMLSLFPDTHVVVSTRPIGLPKQWQDDARFTRADILPMRPDDTRTFIQKWHQAASRAGTPFGFRSFAEAERAMQEIARTRPAIRALTNTPLLCALICALHLKQGSNLPKNRIEVYDTALTMLLAARDNERRVEVSNVDLSLGQRRIVIREFALWMHENGLADAAENDYLVSVGKTLQRILGTDSHVHDAAHFLLERSGVLREPVPKQVDFVHRTFLEYLAACAIVEDNSIEKLVLHAEDDHWREVIVLAAGVAQKHQREQLLRRLLEVGRAKPHSRHRVFLLAIACLETAPELAVDLREQLQTAVSEVVPPKSMTEALSIASAGLLAVPLLRSAPDLKARPAAASVRALCMIGTDDALDSLASYSNERRKTVTRELLRAWPNFDPEKYATSVLSGVDLSREPAIITDPALVPALSHLRPDSSVFLDVPNRYETLSQLPDLPDFIYGANLSGVQDLITVSDIRLKNAESLVLDSTSLESLRGIEEHPDLFFFSAANSRYLREGAGLEGHERLREFIISGAPLQSVSFLATIKSPARRITLRSMDQLSRIDQPINGITLRIQDCKSLSTLTGIESSTHLKSLFIQRVPVRLLTLPNQLATLSLRQIPSDIDLDGGESLNSVTLPVEALSTRLDWLLELKALRSISLISDKPCKLSAARTHAVQELTKSASELEYVRFGGSIDVGSDLTLEDFERRAPRDPRTTGTFYVYEGGAYEFGGAQFRRVISDL